MTHALRPLGVATVLRWAGLIPAAAGLGACATAQPWPDHAPCVERPAEPLRLGVEFRGLAFLRTSGSDSGQARTALWVPPAPSRESRCVVAANP